MSPLLDQVLAGEVLRWLRRLGVLGSLLGVLFAVYVYLPLSVARIESSLNTVTSIVLRPLRRQLEHQLAVSRHARPFTPTHHRRRVGHGGSHRLKPARPPQR